ncbi:MAG: phosphoribosylglycinamide formyltransferase, partial [Cyanobacteria bacterium J06621_12]
MSESVTRNNYDHSGTVLVSPDLPNLSSAKSTPIQLGIMASGSGTNFAAVAKAIAEGKLNAEIRVLIYNNPDAKVKQKA